jgi:hypothetical protein
MSVSNNITHTMFKVLDVGFIYTVSFIIGFAVVIMMEHLFGAFTPTNNPSVVLVFFELIGILWFYGIVIYLVNKLIYNIPFPFHGVYGYNHFDFKDDLGAWMVEYVVLFWYFAISIQNRIIYIHNKIMGTSIPFNYITKAK